MKKIFSTAIIAAICLTACGGGASKKTEGKPNETPVVKTMQVEDRDVNQVGNYTASVEPELINNITASSPNRIKKILVDEGMKVAAGQTLVIMDDVNNTSYEIQLNNAKANLRNVETEYKRAQELFKIGGGTRQQVDMAEVQLINARNNVAAAERTLRNIRENTVLKSPISGVVTARNYDPGDMAATLPILTVARIQPVKIVINVTEADLPKVKRGMPATVTFDTYGDELFNGTVTMVSPTIDAASRTFGAEVTIKNSDGRILPGMFGRVQLSLGNARRVVVPDKAVVKQQGSGNHYVYVMKSDGTVSYNKVELGQRLGDSYELISGVEPGSEVVISGQNKLANGVKVKVVK